VTIRFQAADITEDAAALEFSRIYRDRLAYCHSTGVWYEYDGSIWRAHKTPLAFHYARELMRTMSGDVPAKGQFQKTKYALGVEKFSQADPIFARTSDHWNRDAFLLGTPGGTVDLRTGKLRTAMPSDHINKATAVPPSSAACPLWMDFLKDATGGDPALIRFLQQIAGYSLTGDIREHALFFIYGPGGNGKSVYLNTVTKIVGDYGETAAMATFEKSASNGIPADLAMLNGARLVTASETEEGRSWAEAKVKQMTGGDQITARFMRQNFFTFSPSFKLVIVGNHKPTLSSVDEALKRRFNIIPFTVKPQKPDRELEAKLEKEWPAILGWMIEGCLDWQKNGLVRPTVVTDATNEYFSEQNTVQQWIDEYCECDLDNPYLSESATALFSSWSKFAERYGEGKQSMKSFASTLQREGFTKKRTGQGIFYQMIRLRGKKEDE
jgi:putative DNA primase/helicase